MTQANDVYKECFNTAYTFSLSKVTLQLSGNREGSNSITIYINYNI